ncbi:sodium/myo-inositol cotransporter 2-like, partial [Microcaecilia unicolor]
VIVQRSLSAKNLSHAKGGSLLAAYLKVLPLFIMVLPGMISRVLFPDMVACADRESCKSICGNPSGCSDIAYPKLVIEILPTGLRGLMMSVMIAALMSSLTSIFNSASTIFTIDLWRHFRPRSSEWELMIVGRVFVLVLVVVSILWIPLVQSSQGGQLFIYIQSISSYLQPPVAVVFVAGCFWKRTNEKGAFWGLITGLAVGICRMVLDFVYVAPQCDETDTRPAVVKDVHYLYFAIILAVFTLIVVVIISLLTKPPSQEMVSRLTWFTRWDSDIKTPERATTPTTSAPDSEDPREAERPPATVDMNAASEDAPCEPSNTTTVRSRLKKIFYWLCGMETNQDAQTNVAPVVQEPIEVLLHENSFVKQILDVNMIVCISAGIFLWGYFA